MSTSTRHPRSRHYRTLDCLLVKGGCPHCQWQGWQRPPWFKRTLALTLGAVTTFALITAVMLRLTVS